MHYDYKKICEKCKNATDLCGGEDDTKLCYLSDEQALKAINQGMPIGFRSSHPGYHGSDAGLYHFTMADTSDKFYAFKKADSYENSAAYHYVLSDEEIRFLNSKLGKADHLLYEQLIQERAEMNRRNQNESLYSMVEEDDEQIINHSTRSR